MRRRPAGERSGRGEVTATERTVIAAARRLLAAPGRGVEVGIGDDAAVLRAGQGRWIWTVDASVEGVHFDRRWLTLADVGWRSFQAAASDLAAMGARPVAALSSLILPMGTTRREVAALVRGQAEAARTLGCPVVGGNVSSGDVWSVTTTVLGQTTRPLLRSGARAGQSLWLLGDVGLAAAGLRLLAGAAPALRQTRAGRACVRAWRRPRALLEAGLAAGPGVTSAIDLSDGLGGDAGQLANASGVRLVIEEAGLRDALRPELEPVAAALGLEPLALALGGGEDYALLFTGDARGAPAGARRIGRVEAGSGAVLEGSTGRPAPLAPGYEHGRR